MKNFLRLTTLVLSLSITSAFAQQNSKQVGKTNGTKPKLYVYEFSVTGLQSQAQASKMDSTFSGRGSIVKWETDLEHKKVKVTASYPFVYSDLMKVCHNNQLEASEEHTVKEIEQH